MPPIRLSALLLGFVSLHGCAARAAPPAAPRGYTVVAEYPHDTTAYTQGLIRHTDGTLFESTGIYGQSELRKVALQTGAVLERIALPANRFGEGLTALGGKLYQLTWQSNIAYVYDQATFRLIDSIAYPGEGWGLTTDGTSLIMTDGGDTIRFLDPATFAVQKTVAVRFASSEAVSKLNELEYIRGELFANVYQSDWILRIDPVSGRVTDILDLGRLLSGFSARDTDDNVLNGIAFDEATGHLYVTGKRWPRLFELKLSRPPGTQVP